MKSYCITYDPIRYVSVPKTDSNSFDTLIDFSAMMKNMKQVFMQLPDDSAEKLKELFKEIDGLYIEEFVVEDITNAKR